MKNYQFSRRSCALALKSILLFFISIIFSSAYSQVTDITGFNELRERQQAVEQGVHADEIEGFLQSRKEYLKAQYDFKVNGIGVRKTTPPKQNTFIRKSGSNCVGDFENGTVAPWSGWRGTSNGIFDIVNDITVYTSGVVSGIHTIMNVGNDPVVSSIARVHSGDHSLRLGNSSVGAQTERVSRNVTVTKKCFSFWYALIFQNPNHPYNQQPFFMFRIKDSTGNLIDSFVREASNSSFFSNQGSIRYRDWTQYSVDLSNYLGQTVEIEFTTADCRQTAHYGYAYIDDVCFEDCCNSCEDLFNWPGTMANYEVLSYKYSTETHCCYDFDWIFDYDIFACDPYGVKIYEEGNESNPYVDYLRDETLIAGSGGTIFDESLLDFCISKTDFNGNSKTIRIAFLNSQGEVICDTMKQVLEPCHSSDSSCNCSSLFKHPYFAQASIVSSDTSLGDPWECCFRVNPYTDEDKLNCPYYGLRIYKDSSAFNSTYLDTLSPTPMGGPGSTYPDSLNYIFCLSKTQFNNGPIPIRIEYLDSSGKVICSKTEEIECDESCCKNITYIVTKLSTDDIENCCYSISGQLGNCYQTQTVELLKFNGVNWLTIATQSAPMGSFYFDSLCQPLGDTAKYVVTVRDTLGNIICQKEFETYCKDCCAGIDAFMVSVPQSPFSIYPDQCCWDFYYYAQSFEGCPSPYSWYLFDEYDTVPAQFPPFTISMGDSLGRYCIPIYGISPAPGTSITVWYKIKKQLALYDQFGNLICIKIMEDSCSRTYSSPSGGGDPTGPPLDLQVSPNPFTGLFAATMQLPTAMAVEIKVLNGSGIPVFQNNYGIQPQGSFNTNINLSGQPSGIYTLSVNNGQATIQIVKQ